MNSDVRCNTVDGLGIRLSSNRKRCYDDMDPADMRKARIENAKAKSAYNKALKAAGIDPSTVSD